MLILATLRAQDVKAFLKYEIIYVHEVLVLSHPLNGLKAVQPKIYRKSFEKSNTQVEVPLLAKQVD